MTTQISGLTGVSQCQPGSVSQDDLAANVVGKGPAFSTYPSGVGQTITSSVWTKVNLFVEVFDTNNNFDTVAFRFLPTIAGYYQINGSIGIDGSTGITSARAGIYKNGSPYLYGDGVLAPSGTQGSAGVSTIIFLNGSSDYIELWAAISGTTCVINKNATHTSLSGFLARAA